MSPKNTGDFVPRSEGAIVEQGIVLAVDDVLAVGTVGPEPSIGLKREQETNTRWPWYKTPSAWWLISMTVMGTLFGASKIAPQAELYIKFACDELRPEYSVDANIAPFNSTPSGTQVDVPFTFVQRNPLLDDQIIKPTLLRPDKRCAQDPAVHRAAAKLSAGITSAEGIFSLLTVGWWTQYSDRTGRTKVMAISAFAHLIEDALLILVAPRAEILPGGYRILILGGALKGLSGGSSASVALGHAYVAECSSPQTRSQIFSIWLGCMYVGSALGPSLGSWINSYSNDLLSMFYIGTVIHLIYGIFMAFIVPESLSQETRAKARELYEADMSLRSQTVVGSLWRLTSFVHPLGVFIPRRLPAGRGNRASKDWSLTLVGVAATVVAINGAVYPFKNQYALKTFHWSSVQLGYWLSVVGVWRALYLSIILPGTIKALYARQERLSNCDDSYEKEAQVKKIDLLVARASVAIDLVGFLLIGIVTNQAPFIGATIVLAFGGGFSPSAQSLTIALASPSAHIARKQARAYGTSIPSSAKQEIGRLFGALAIVHSLGKEVVGPALFGIMFSETVANYPRAIFWLCVIILSLALGALGAVRLNVEPTAENPEHEPLLA